MEACSIETQWPADELLVKYQYISDFFIAFAYFSIPLELIYFVQKSAFFPYRWVLMQFGAFIVLCGATHFINLWTFSMHSKTVAIVMTISKLATAVVSCATALMLVHIFPDLPSVGKRERVGCPSSTPRCYDKQVGQKVCLVTHSIPKYDVAEGILTSIDPFKKVNGEVLGTEFWKVLVEKAIIPNACLERPQKGARTIREVVGRSVAWRACDVMFDED